jgi:dienelactone hydrolase
MGSNVSPFAEAGFVVLVHVHRNFGSSEGAIRHDIDPWRQIADWRRAISFLESMPEVDATRIGVWGTSCAGRHFDPYLGQFAATSTVAVSGFRQHLGQDQ